MELSALETIMETNYGADGNFWNATADGLNTQQRSAIVNAFPDLAPVQNEL